MDERPSVLLSRAEAVRVRTSRLLLVALVKEHELSLDQAAERLSRWMVRVRQDQHSFLFDLGWRENLASGFHSLSNLNWVTEHRSTLTYQATNVGISHLNDRRTDVETAIGIPLDHLIAIP